MTKSEMMAALNDVFTDRRLDRGLVEQALAATRTEPVPILDDYMALASGGSSPSAACLSSTIRRSADSSRRYPGR